MLQEELQENLDRPVEFYVYNSDTDEVRVVVLMPTMVTFAVPEAVHIAFILFDLLFNVIIA